MGESVLEDFSNRRYSDEHELSRADKKRIEIVLKLIGSGNKVLDIGCRDGSISRMIMEKGNTVSGVDVSTNQVSLARENGVEAYHVNADSALPFEDGTFSLVFAGEVIEHVLDTDRFVCEARRVLSPGGKILLTTPNVASFGRRMLLGLGRNPYLENTLRDEDAGHVRYFTKGCLKKLLEWHGFNVIHFASEAVNLDRKERFQSGTLARLFPTIGRSLIMLAEKV